MKCRISLFVVSSFLSGIIAASGVAYSRSTDAGVRFFGQGAPVNIQGLPAGDLRKSIESLPAQARDRALAWLRVVEFSEQDLPFMKADPQGGIYYADTFISDAASQSRTAKPDGSLSGTMTGKALFKLHSRPGAAHTIHVDFDGGAVSGTAWNTYHGVQAWKAMPYDTDGKKDSFSSGEINDMTEIWQQVAEDYLPFDVDVTTEDPGKRGPKTGWILVTNSTDGSSKPLPEPGAGGVAYLNTFGYSQTAYYSPVFVYYNNLKSPAAVGDVVSHEMAHTVGLTHDGSTDSGKTAGNGGSIVSWSPIMSLDHSGHITQWSRGDYRGATNTQDDIGILTGSLGLRGDDHEDSRFAKATPLLIDARGRIDGNDVDIDVDHSRPGNRGVIENRDDIDAFFFNAGAGAVDIKVTPAWEAYHQSSHLGANLDIHLVLYNAAGKKIAENDPRNDTAANLKVRIPAGRYSLEVEGVGNTAIPYSDYGSLGQYYIAGSVPARGNQAVAGLTK